MIPPRLVPFSKQFLHRLQYTIDKSPSRNLTLLLLVTTHENTCANADVFGFKSIYHWIVALLYSLLCLFDAHTMREANAHIQTNTWHQRGMEILSHEAPYRRGEGSKIIHASRSMRPRCDSPWCPLSKREPCMRRQAFLPLSQNMKANKRGRRGGHRIARNRWCRGSRCF